MIRAHRPRKRRFISISSPLTAMRDRLVQSLIVVTILNFIIFITIGSYTAGSRWMCFERYYIDFVGDLLIPRCESLFFWHYMVVGSHQEYGFLWITILIFAIQVPIINHLQVSDHDDILKILGITQVVSLFFPIMEVWNANRNFSNLTPTLWNILINGGLFLLISTLLAIGTWNNKRKLKPVYLVIFFIIQIVTLQGLVVPPRY